VGSISQKQEIAGDLPPIPLRSAYGYSLFRQFLEAGKIPPCHGYSGILVWIRTCFSTLST